MKQFRVYWKGEHPKKKKQFLAGEFKTRQQVRNWCRNHSWLPELTMVHPNNTEEPFNKEPQQERQQ